MAKITTKPIVAIIGSRSIKNLQIGRYIRPTSPAQIISGGANGVDSIAEYWAKSHKIDFVAFLPNYKIYGKRAPLVRDEEMVDAADVVIAFWDGVSTGTLYTIQYAYSIGRKCIVHLIEERD